MTEQTLVWVRRTPPKPVEPGIDEQQLSASLAEACTGCGYQLKEFIAAKGSFGSWLAQLGKDGHPHRVIWNGKDGRLVLEGAGRHAGWEEIASTVPGRRDVEGLVGGVKSLLAAPATAGNDDAPG
jgi:hypothetical protein